MVRIVLILLACLESDGKRHARHRPGLAKTKLRCGASLYCPHGTVQTRTHTGLLQCFRCIAQINVIFAGCCGCQGESDSVRGSSGHPVQVSSTVCTPPKHSLMQTRASAFANMMRSFAVHPSLWLAVKLCLAESFKASNGVQPQHMSVLTTYKL